MFSLVSISKVKLTRIYLVAATEVTPLSKINSFSLTLLTVTAVSPVNTIDLILLQFRQCGLVQPFLITVLFCMLPRNLSDCVGFDIDNIFDNLSSSRVQQGFLFFKKFPFCLRPALFLLQLISFCAFCFFTVSHCFFKILPFWSGMIWPIFLQHGIVGFIFVAMITRLGKIEARQLKIGASKTFQNKLRPAVSHLVMKSCLIRLYLNLAVIPF